MHKKVKEAAGLYKRHTLGRLVDTNGTIIVDKEKKMDTWKTYVADLFNDARSSHAPTNDSISGPFITKEEVWKAISNTKNGKAPGPDNIHSEFLKLLDEDGINWLTRIFNKIYKSGQIRMWLKSIFVTPPKKSSAKQCSDYRTISLMSHLLKMFLKIIHQRIQRVCEQHLGRTQFGFRNALGIREALFCVQVLFQRCRDMNCDVYACFVNYQKAFD